MLKTLIKKQLLELFSNYVVDRKTGKARNKGAILFYIALMLFIFGSLGFAFYSMAGGLGAVMLGHGFNWLYFALMGLLSIALGVFGSVFNTYASLYLPKDNEFLMSLPIPGRTLVAARTAGVYCMSLMYSAWIWIPVMIAYWVIVPVNVLNIIFPIILTFVIALFVTVLSCILGWIVALISLKAKGKSFLTVFLSLFVLVMYYVICFKVVKSLGEIVNHLDSLGHLVRSWLHYVYLLGMAADGDVLSMILTVGITVGISAVCLYVLIRTFTRFALAEDKTGNRKKKVVGYGKRSAGKALLNREFKHFTSLPMWMLNGGLGLLIMPAAAIGVIIKHDSIRAFLSGELGTVPGSIINAVPLFLLSLIAIIIATNSILGCSVSLEGKTLWILQTLPLDPWEILFAKEKMGILLNIFPALFTSAVFCIVFGFDVAEAVLFICATVIFIVLMQDFGLFLNIIHPDFSWTNPTNVIKQSLPVFFCMFGGWIFCGLIALGGYFLCKAAGIYITMLAVIVLIAALTFVLRRFLKTKGAKMLQYM